MNFFPNEQISLSAEGEGPKDVEKETQQLERAFKPMPFLSKFWEMQVRVYSTEITHQQGSSMRQGGQFLHYLEKRSSLFSYNYLFPLNWYYRAFSVHLPTKIISVTFLMLLSPFIPLVDGWHLRRFYCTQWDLVKGVCLHCFSLRFWEGRGYSDRDFQQCLFGAWLIIETATYNQFKTLWRASFLFPTFWVDQLLHFDIP